VDKKLDKIIFLLEILILLSAFLFAFIAWSIIKIILVIIVFCLFASTLIYISYNFTRKILRDRFFTLRSYTPIPFLLLMIVFAEPTVATMLLGFCSVVLGEFFRFYGVAYAGSLTRVTGSVGAPQVIVAGPFSRVRNPLYVGNMLTYIGIGIMSNALFPWLVFAALVWFSFQYYQIVMAEEEFLEKEFGEAYLEFKNNVPRFLPQLVPYKSSAQEHQLPNWKEAAHSERRTFQALALVLAILLVLWLVR